MYKDIESECDEDKYKLEHNKDDIIDYDSLVDSSTEDLNIKYLR